MDAYANNLNELESEHYSDNRYGKTALLKYSILSVKRIMHSTKIRGLNEII